MIRALFDRSIFALWFGQVLSGVGDEVYRVAFTWICVQEVGKDAGWLSVLLVLAGLVGAGLASRWFRSIPSDRVLIRLDLYRAGITLIPVVCYPFPQFRFPALVFATVLLFGLSAVFEPVLMELLPRVARTPELLRGANGLMATTYRLARVVGPSIVGVLTAWVPLVHFFTINALSFLGSASSIRSIGLPQTSDDKDERGAGGLVEAWHSVRRVPGIYRSLWAKCVSGGAWSLAYGVGLALLVEEMRPGEVSTYGTLIAAYGVGNLAGALGIGSLRRTHPELWIYGGLIWLGIGFLALSGIREVFWLHWAIGLTAMGGPVNDLPFVDLAQAHFRPLELSDVFRVKVILDSLITLVFFALSPWAFQVLGVRKVMAVCGAIMLLSGIVSVFARNSGIFRQGSRDTV